jgi:hypothetical protein
MRIADIRVTERGILITAGDDVAEIPWKILRAMMHNERIRFRVRQILLNVYPITEDSNGGHDPVRDGNEYPSPD